MVGLGDYGIGVQGFLSGDGSVLKLMEVMLAHICDCTKHYQIMHFKWEDSMLMELYFNKAVKKKS